MVRRLIEVERHEDGPRLRVVGQRVHHGAVGIVLAVLRHDRRVLVLAAGLVWHDRRDWRRWGAPGAQR